jgi:hypothetical protein
MNNFILFWISLFVSVFFSQIVITLFHELAHKRELNKKGISCEIKWNVKGIVKSLGICSLAGCFFDKNKFENLSAKSKRRIIYAGIKVDLLFTMLFLILAVLSWFYLKGSFVWYYLNLTTFTLILRVFLDFFGKGSDGGRLRRG